MITREESHVDGTESQTRAARPPGKLQIPTPTTPASTRRMVVIGLLDIPPEMQIGVAEFAETSQQAAKTLKALSLTSRSFRRIAQSVLFKTFTMNIRKELRGSIDDLLANPQICASIRYLELWGCHPFSRITSRVMCDNHAHWQPPDLG